MIFFIVAPNYIDPLPLLGFLRSPPPSPRDIYFRLLLSFQIQDYPYPLLGQLFGTSPSLTLIVALVISIYYNNYFLSAVILIGDTYAGKTPLVQRFIRNTFCHNGLATLGIDLAMRNVYIGGEVIKVQIWDTGICITWSITYIGVIMYMCACIHASTLLYSCCCECQISYTCTCSVLVPMFVNKLTIY